MARQISNNGRPDFDSIEHFRQKWSARADHWDAGEAAFRAGPWVDDEMGIGLYARGNYDRRKLDQLNAGEPVGIGRWELPRYFAATLPHANNYYLNADSTVTPMSRIQ